MNVDVVIPWRPGCRDRENALAYVLRWWEDTHPQWNVHIGLWPKTKGPWRKGCAIKSANINPTLDGIVIVADADVIPVGIDAAVKAVGEAAPSHKKPLWAVPFRGVYRLSYAGTQVVLAGLPLVQDEIRSAAGLLDESYVGSPGGGAVVLLGSTFMCIPIDPRFYGYGQEDHSWACALHRLAGAPAMINEPLWHLWHPAQPRMVKGATTSRGVGSEDGLRLWQRYREASIPSMMSALVAEATAAYGDFEFNG